MKSLNEIEWAVAKAARGAGLDWGSAEELGWAARWLEARDLAGAALALAAIEEGGATLLLGQRMADRASLEFDVDPAIRTLRPELHRFAPDPRGAPSRPPVGRGGREPGLKPRTTSETPAPDAVACPLLLAPFVEQVASALGGSVEIAWDGAGCAIGPDDRFSTQGAPQALQAAAPSRVSIRKRMDSGLPIHPPRAQGRAVDGAVWTRLAELAHRTYVPASDASRLAGAGAGVTDND